MRYLLDSNVWIKVLQGYEMPLLDRFSREDPGSIHSCSPVRAELLHGAEKYANAARRKELVTGLLNEFASLPFDDACAETYARIRHDLELRGCVIGPYDMQIAAIALPHEMILVTGNIREFERVHDLKIENWSFSV